MNNRKGSFLALFFAACFLALQFNAVAETQFEQSDNQNFQIQVVSDRLIDNSFANSAINERANSIQPVSGSQWVSKFEQRRQVFESNEQRCKHRFEHFMRQNLAAICQAYQHQLSIAFSYQQHLDLSGESTPLLTRINRQPPPEEPDQIISE